MYLIRINYFNDGETLEFTHEAKECHIYMTQYEQTCHLAIDGLEDISNYETIMNNTKCYIEQFTILNEHEQEMYTSDHWNAINSIQRTFTPSGEYISEVYLAHRDMNSEENIEENITEN